MVIHIVQIVELSRRAWQRLARQLRSNLDNFRSNGNEQKGREVGLSSLVRVIILCLPPPAIKPLLSIYTEISTTMSDIPESPVDEDEELGIPMPEETTPTSTPKSKHHCHVVSELTVESAGARTTTTTDYVDAPPKITRHDVQHIVSGRYTLILCPTLRTSYHGIIPFPFLKWMLKFTRGSATTAAVSLEQITRIKRMHDKIAGRSISFHIFCVHYQYNHIT